MEDSFIQLDDLPDEILTIILKKLPNYQVLYSLIDVNERLDTIAQDSIFTSYLTLVPCRNDLKQFTNRMLHRFCDKILPIIGYKIQWLNVDSSFMDRIFLSTIYPNLTGLGLYNVALETARDLFTNTSYFIHIFENQLSSLVIYINEREEPRSSIKDINIFLFTQIFAMFNNLQCLNLNPFDLRVVVDSYEDCLYLLDGRFNKLNKFNVTICSSNVPSLPLINNKKKLSNLKCFLLRHKSVLLVYNTFLIPLLHRMSNLEELSLYFVNHNTPIIDGNDLEMNIMNYMRKLKKFKFNIRSVISLNNQVYLPSHEYIQNTFKNLKNNQIISCIDYFPKANEFHCHIYSYPYTWNYYDNITNNFHGGLFKRVYEISLFDERSFEREFFLKIAKSFPCIEELRLHNREPQKNDNQQWSIIEYPHLIRLDLVQTHENYVEQFLNNTKVCLLNDIDLRVDYNTLQRVAGNFTSDATRINCSKIKCLFLYNEPELSLDLKDYFPLAKIC
ncbi:unnamed protein product [Rotaria sp. Silwood1]|nr:unnamed protein product [Rotaria sp. Silwood1]CAF1659108.1 unnamed protein product [Rotaria sp. Silwood1]